MKDIERIQIHIGWRLIIVSININVDEDNTDDYDDVHTSLSVSSSEQKLFFYTKINKTNKIQKQLKAKTSKPNKVSQAQYI